MPVLPLSLREAGLALALASLPALAAPALAQRSAEEARTVDGYRITMPLVRKVLPALYAPGGQGCEPSSASDPQSMSLTEMTRRLERCAPVHKALAQAGVKPREAAIFFAALLRTSEMTARHGGKASAIPAGVIRANALLLEQNDAEIRRITEGGDRS